MDSTVTAAPPLQPPKLAGYKVATVWPPSQRVRDAIIARVIMILSTPSFLFNRTSYMEAAVTARRAEKEAYEEVLSNSASADGIDMVLQYTMEITKRLSIYSSAAEGDD